MYDDTDENKMFIERNEFVNPCDRSFYNSRTRQIRFDDKIIYFFNYAKDNCYGEEVITWRELKDLKDKKQWSVIKHPMVLNFINEKLLGRAVFYILHIIAYLAFLLLLSSYIFDKNALQDALATVFLIIFGFCLIVKGAIKLQAGKVSSWFVVSYLFNIITYIATFLFIWTPQLFAYNDYESDLKHFITWFLPIIAIISAWINFLYILRKSPYGIYILMMTRIFYSFSQIAIIWIPTLLAFAFAFHLVMRNSGTEPWEASDVFTPNSTVTRKLLAILQAITKTSAMMIGEVDADNVLERKEWIPNILLLAFEITTVILLMNLMISLAVGDVNELRHSAQEKLLQIKVNFTIEALQLSETCDCLKKLKLLHRISTNNILVLANDGQVYSMMKKVDFCEKKIIQVEVENENAGKEIYRHKLDSNSWRSSQQKSSQQYRREQIHLANLADEDDRPFINGISDTNNKKSKVYYLHFPSNERRMRLQKRNLAGHKVHVHLDGATIELIESMESGIEEFSGTVDGLNITDVDDDSESNARKLARWLIGLDWSSLLDL